MEIRSGQRFLSNKLAFWSRVVSCRSPASTLLSCHRGDGSEVGGRAALRCPARWGSSAPTTLWSASSTALRRHQADQPSTLMAEGRPLRALTCAADPRIDCRHQLSPNLLAGVPEWRPILSFCRVAFFGDLVPSGIVPGDDVAGCVCELRREIGGDRLDGFSVITCRVLFTCRSMSRVSEGGMVLFGLHISKMLHLLSMRREYVWICFLHYSLMI
jgi:hypothetical protein